AFVREGLSATAGGMARSTTPPRSRPSERRPRRSLSLLYLEHRSISPFPMWRRQGFSPITSAGAVENARCGVSSNGSLPRDRKRGPVERMGGLEVFPPAFDPLQLGGPQGGRLALAGRQVLQERLHQPRRLDIGHAPQAGDDRLGAGAALEIIALPIDAATKVVVSVTAK